MSVKNKVNNIYLDYGADLSLPITVTGLDLTGFTEARMSIRKTVNDETTLLDLTTMNNKLTIVGQVITINISGVESKLIHDGSVYDLFIVNMSGTAIKLSQGKIQLIASVKRW